MPRSKRDKEVSLTKVGKKRREAKSKLIDDVRSCIDSYQRVFVFSVANMRNCKLKDVRMKLKKSCRFFFGKTKVMALALGRIREEEFRDNLHKVAKQLSGQRGLLFSNSPKDEIIQHFADYAEPEFARSGATASKTVTIDAGPLDYWFTHSMEPQLRTLGLPTHMQKGVVTLAQDFTICTEGEKLTPEKAKLLKLFGISTMDFRVNLLCVWEKDSAKFETLVKKTKSENTKKQKSALQSNDESSLMEVEGKI